MVVSYAFRYMVARGGPGIVNLAALLLFARLLAPAEFGHYALVLAATGLANAMLFWWLPLGLLRFFPAYRERRAALLSALLVGYVTMVAATAILGGVLLLAAASLLPRHLVALACVLLWVQAWHELNLELARSELAPGRYGRLLLARSLLLVGAGGLLAWLGFGAVGVIAGAIVAAAIPSILAARRHWAVARWHLVDRAVLGELAQYGAPLVLTSGLMIVVVSSDRFFISVLATAADVGTYAVGSDLAQFTLGTLMNAVYLGFFPLALGALEREGIGAARATLNRAFVALLAIGLPAAVGLALLAGGIARELIGSEFRGAAAVLPWIAFAALVGALKAFYCDLSFQLGRQTRTQLYVAAATATANILLNWIMIPRWGLVGAAQASVMSLSAGALLSAWLGRRVFPLPLPLGGAARVAAAVLLMCLAILPLLRLGGLAALILQVVAGAAAYTVAVVIFNVLDARTWLLARIGRRGATPAPTSFSPGEAS